MLPLAIPMLLSAAQAIPNIWHGIKQNETANKLASELNRPDFDIPESQKRGLQSAENQAGMTRLPGQSGIEGRLDQTTSNQIDTIERMGAGGPTSLNAAAAAYGNQQNKETDLGVAASNQWSHNQESMRNQLDRMSEWEFKKWSWDKQLPYQNKADAIAALREGSMRNLDTAAKDVFGGAANVALGSSLYGQDNNWMNGKEKIAPTATGLLNQQPVSGVAPEALMTEESAYPLRTELGLTRKPVWSAFDMGMPK